MRSCLTSAVVAATLLLAPARAAAEPRPMAEAAHRHLDRGRALFEAGNYAGAIAELDVGFAIDPHPDFLYAKGQAQRMLADCAGAIESFRAFLASGPPARAAEAARFNIERCRDQLAAREAARPPAGRIPADTGSTAAPEAPAGATPWYRDRIGGALAVGATVALGTGVTFLLLADRHVDRILETDDLDDYRSERHLVSRDRTIGAISLALAGALAAGAIVRYATRPERRSAVQIGGAVSAQGASVSLGGEF